MLGWTTISQTDFGYTGQRNLDELGLMDYKARMYDPYDIQYHYIIGPDGSIYEGRDLGIRGSHVAGLSGNTGKVGILWLGVSTSRGDTPTPQQMASTINLVEYLDAEYGIDELGGLREYEQKVGSYTECPGDHALIYANALKPFVR